MNEFDAGCCRCGSDVVTLHNGLLVTARTGKVETMHVKCFVAPQPVRESAPTSWVTRLLQRAA